MKKRYLEWVNSLAEKNINVGILFWLLIAVSIILFGVVKLVFAQFPDKPTPTPTPMVYIVDPTATDTPLPAPIVIDTPTPTPSPLPTNTPTNTPTPLPTNTPLPTVTSTNTPTPTPSPTNTPAPTNTPTPTPTPVFQVRPLPLGFNPGWCIKVYSNRGLLAIWSVDRFMPNNEGYWYLSQDFLGLNATLEYRNEFLPYTFTQCGVYLQ